MLTGLLLGSVITGLVAVVVAMLVKGSKKGSKEAQVTPEESARNMSQQDKETMIQNFSGVAVPLDISGDIKAQISNLQLDWVETYGAKYKSISDAIDSCDDITEYEEAKLRRIDAQLAAVRVEYMAARRYYEIKEMIDEDIYVYQPRKFQMDAKVRTDAGLPSRVGIELVYDTEGPKPLKMKISSIFVSKFDVSVSANRYEFDKDNTDDEEAFDLLIRGKSEYKPEIKELEKIEKRLARYNELVDLNRVARGANGEIIILPPSPEEIKAKRAADRNEVFGSTQPANDTPTKEEAKNDVNEAFNQEVQQEPEFVSSTLLDN
jgi:hypothetical protein